MGKWKFSITFANITKSHKAVGVIGFPAFYTNGFNALLNCMLYSLSILRKRLYTNASGAHESKFPVVFPVQ